ncbi:MAG: NUDIX hydrolase [Lachnospiraceae bacterium]|jgi:ADP-ribose pyrophosphatase|nr:NUDIX hydrolase [Lachnospiraceae bacterium]MEE3460280.1 NUDIX hydrolase [Lachnospiraceae bacterium]
MTDKERKVLDVDPADLNADHYSGLERQTDNPFLNMYRMDAVKNNGDHFNYYFASRRSDDEVMMKTHKLWADGVVIYPVMKDDPGKIVLLRQFRYPVNQYIYELPAGLVDKGETPELSAVREMREETGLKFTVFDDYPEFLKRPAVQNQGMCDECDRTVFGFAEGDFVYDRQEKSEDIQAFKADKNFVKKVLADHVTSIRCQYLLTMFLLSDPADPFGWLKKLG